jgi:hypothetical protein
LDKLFNKKEMNIHCTFGIFKIIQSVSNEDELLVLSEWESLKNCLKPSRIFLVNNNDAVLGFISAKKECLDAMNEMIKNIDYRDWDHLKLEKDHFYVRSNAS